MFRLLLREREIELFRTALSVCLYVESGLVWISDLRVKC